ncbi:MAG: anthranilate phosphoribosyltransferase [Ilumatobacteraceae bacterium]|nr:anthranilate phosphoribosyltransferase [Ilumatobacteraceae bacterium]
MTSDSEFLGWPALISVLLDGQDLSSNMAALAVSEILRGDATPSQITAFIIALKAKGETVTELEGMLRAVRSAGVAMALPDNIAKRAIDIVGTGGDKSNSVNVSTMTAFVVAGAGVPVCKHGNRASSSKCGSADVLEALGVAIDLGADDVESCITTTGMGFCLATRFHPSFRHAGPSRREIGVPTAFNLLGPMANPAPIANMLVGVAQSSMMHKMAQVLASRDVTSAWVVHGHGGLDELALSGANTVVQLCDGVVTELVVDAVDLGISRSNQADIEGGDANTNGRAVHAVLSSQEGPVRDIVVLNSAAALVVAGAAADLSGAKSMAQESIDSGAAARVLGSLIQHSQELAARAAS